MHNYIYSILFLSSIVLFGCQTQETANQEPFPPLIPKPQYLEIKKGSFILTKNTTLFFEEDFKNAGDFLINYIQKGSGFQLDKTSGKEAAIIFKKDSSLLPEAYTLTVSNSNIIVNAKDESGAFYAVQTLRQLMSATLENSNEFQGDEIVIPQV